MVGPVIYLWGKREKGRTKREEGRRKNEEGRVG
jgi:hypothetical protein